MARRGDPAPSLPPSVLTTLALIVLSVVSAWIVALAVAMRWQSRLLFGVPRARRTAPAGPHAGHRTRAVAFDAPDGARLQGWWSATALPTEGVVVWLGGRNEDVGWTPALGSWLGAGWAVCAFNYRGRGGSTGEATQANAVDDAAAIVAWATTQARVEPGRVVLVGRSLGGAVAVHVAAGRCLAGLVLLSPPASIRRILLRNPLLWPGLPWLRHPFDALAQAHRVACPSLVLLAGRDRRVPHRDSRALARALPACTPAHGGLRTIAGTDHRTLARHPDTLAAIAAFAQSLPSPAS